jgi:hypothetical protein
MTGEVEAADPITGEVLEHLDQQPPEKLAETLANIYRRQEQFKTWEAAIAGELRQRLKLHKTRRRTFGDWEVQASVIRSAEWDGPELEGVLQELVDEGVIRAADAVGIVTRDPVVSKSKAGQLVSRLTGDAQERLATLRTWKEKPGKLTVARSVDLLDAAPAAEETPPQGGHAGRDGAAPQAVPAAVGSSEPTGATTRAPSTPHAISPTSSRDDPSSAGPAVSTLDPAELFA